MKNYDLFALKKFIEDFGIELKEEIRENTEIEYDLRITGDDAVDFILSFGNKFNVDVSSFQLAEYFESEGKLLPVFFNIMYNHSSKKKLTIRHLLDAMNSHILNPI